jgi:hypothetical protein
MGVLWYVREVADDMAISLAGCFGAVAVWQRKRQAMRVYQVVRGNAVYGLNRGEGGDNGAYGGEVNARQLSGQIGGNEGLAFLGLTVNRVALFAEWHGLNSYDCDGLQLIAIA